MKGIFTKQKITMKKITIILIAGAFLLPAQSCTNANSAPKYLQQSNKVTYVCLPCGNDCDTLSYASAGVCSHCKMKLVDKKSIRFANILPNEIASFISKKDKQNVILLDVRTTEEFNGTAEYKFGKLAGAINIPVQDLEKRVTELNRYKGKEIIVYCSHSHRSPMASYILGQNGFNKVTNMLFGMSQWKNKVKPNESSNKFFIEQ